MKSRSVLRTITLLATGLAAASVWGGPVQKLRVPQDIPYPFYAAGLGHTGTNAEDWVVTAFYYPPADIPGDFDLFTGYVTNPPVYVDTPLVVGFVTFVPKNPAIPAQQLLKNAPGVRIPIWFTRVDEFLNGGRTWTVNSMKAEGSLVGYADFYGEADENSPGNFHQGIVASGVMEDGRQFRVESNETGPLYLGISAAVPCRVHFGP